MASSHISMAVVMMYISKKKTCPSVISTNCDVSLQPYPQISVRVQFKNEHNHIMLQCFLPAVKSTRIFENKINVLKLQFGKDSHSNCFPCISIIQLFELGSKR